MFSLYSFLVLVTYHIYGSSQLSYLFQSQKKTTRIILKLTKLLLWNAWTDGSWSSCWFLELNRILANLQCWFRQGRISLDYVVRFGSFIPYGFAHKKHAYICGVVILWSWKDLQPRGNMTFKKIFPIWSWKEICQIVFQISSLTYILLWEKTIQLWLFYQVMLSLNILIICNDIQR